MDTDCTPRVVLTAPKRIYLCLGVECPQDIDFTKLVDVLWCEHKIDQSDVEYVRADQVAKVEGHCRLLLEALVEVLDKIPLTDSGRFETPTAAKARAAIATATGSQT